MSKININIIPWEEASKRLKSSNKIIHDLLAPISLQLKKNKKNYFYQLDYGFGAEVICDGQMVALAKNKDGNYINEKNVRFFPEGFSGNKQNDFKLFVDDCGQDTDHPLSIVTNNYIEIYCTKKSSLQSVGEYSFPLNIFKKGDLFGVWGSVNSVCKIKGTGFFPWNAVAGKACIIPLFPEPQYKKSSDLYRKSFSEIFRHQSNTKDGIISIANEVLGSSLFSQIIIIPKSYYSDLPNEKSEVRNFKFQLREYLFKTAWEQTKTVRDMPWNDRKLIEDFESGFKSVIDIKGHVFAFNFAKHLLNIVQGSSFILKPVEESDEILFDVFRKLVSEFAKHSDKSGTLLDYTTPVFLHYEKLHSKNTKGIELTHSPSINIELPDVRLDIMSNIMQAFVDRGKMTSILKSKGFDISLNYFKESGTGHARNIDRYIESELLPLYNQFLPESHFKKLQSAHMKVKLPKSPSLFNSFLQIERTNW